MEKISDLTTENVCRTCLEYFPEMNSLFDTHYEGENLDGILMSLTQISILKNDGLSNKLCEECFKRLIEFHKFRKVSALFTDP